MTAVEVFDEMRLRVFKRYHVVVTASVALQRLPVFAGWSEIFPVVETIVDATEDFWESMTPYFLPKHREVVVTCAFCSSELCALYGQSAFGNPLLGIVQTV